MRSGTARPPDRPLFRFVTPRPTSSTIAHELVAENVAGAHRRDEPVKQVKIGTADRGRCDAHDRVARVDRRRIGNMFDARSGYVPSQQTAFIVGSHAHPLGHIGHDAFANGWSCRPRHAADPSVVGISPASSNCLKRRRSSRIVWFGSSPKSFATAAPSFPPGGLYCRCTVTRVPCGSSSKFTEPAVEIVDPSSDCQPITLFSTSLMMRASHSTRIPAGPFATQCEIAFLAHRDGLEVLHELRQVLEVAPEPVQLAQRPVDRHRLFHVNAAGSAELGARVGAAVGDHTCPGSRAAVASA